MVGLCRQRIRRLIAEVIQNDIEFGIHGSRTGGTEEDERALDHRLDPRGLSRPERDLVYCRLDSEDSVGIGCLNGAIHG